MGETPRLILVARQNIDEETEMVYDYGDRSGATKSNVFINCLEAGYCEQVKGGR